MYVFSNCKEAVLHYEEPKLDGAVTKSTHSSIMSDKLWITFSEVKLYMKQTGTVCSN